MKKSITTIIISFLSISSLFAQGINISQADSVYNQNFDSLAKTGNSSFMPYGWSFYELGNTTYADGKYETDLFQGLTPGIYSLGDDATNNSNDPQNDPNPHPNDRALGIQLHTSYLPNARIGLRINNNDTLAIQSIQVSFKGETWYRYGNVGGAPPIDTMAFYVRKLSSTSDTFNTDKLDINGLLWTRCQQLTYVLEDSFDLNNFVFVNYAGNLSSNSKTISGLFLLPQNLQIQPGESMYLSWRPILDNGTYNSIGGIDDLHLTFHYGPVGIEDVNKYADISLYPNPASNSVVIRNLKPEDNYSYSIYNLFGQKFMNGNIHNETNHRVDINELPTAIYYINIASDNGTNTNIKLIKQ